MYRAVTIALASALLILAPSAVLARGGGGHGGGGSGGGGHGGGGFGGGHGGFSSGHTGRTFSAVHTGPVGFRAMPGASHGAHVNRHVVAHRFHRRKVFIGGFGDSYYYCYPVWNGYAWVNSCNYDY
jgi:hypothetical protein